MLGQIVMVWPALPEQVAVKVPLVGAVPPGPKLILPKLIGVIEKLQTWADAVFANNSKVKTIEQNSFIDM